MIRVERLPRQYEDLVAVDEVSFDINHGEVVGLLGHNGAGMTTIMKMLTGYLGPKSGSVRVGDSKISQDTRAIQARIGYLPQNCPLYPKMTVIVAPSGAILSWLPAVSLFPPVFGLV